MIILFDWCLTGDCQCAAQLVVAGRQQQQGGAAADERSALSDHGRHGDTPGIDAQVDAVGSVEPVGSLELQQSRHLLHGRLTRVPRSNADVQVGIQDSVRHREWRRHPAQYLQSHRHQ